MAFMHDRVFDAAWRGSMRKPSRLDTHSTEPTSYAESTSLEDRSPSERNVLVDRSMKANPPGPLAASRAVSSGKSFTTGAFAYEEDDEDALLLLL